MTRGNVTLSLPEETLRLARHLAVEKGVSLSRLLSDYLEEVVLRDERYHEARKTALARMTRGVRMGVGSKPTWSREDLHER